MKKLVSTLLLAVLVTATAHAQDDDIVAHLKGIEFLYMELDCDEAREVKDSDIQDFNDIVELQLLRSRISLRPMIANEPEANYPRLQVAIDTSRPGGRSQFFVSLVVRDHVTIRRNGTQTVATTFEIQRVGVAGSSDELPAAVKSELRDLMLEFVTYFRSANPR